MKKLEFITTYRAAATQLNGYTIAGNWMRLAEALETAGVTLTATEAARWADRGFLPEEAGPLILDGITADRHAELEDHTVEQAGGVDAHAAATIAEWLASGALLSEADVVRVADPFDPAREIVTPRDAL